jgi:hypothetical protein
MKHKLLCLALATVTGWTAQAQLSEGGLPLSLRAELKDQYIPTSTYALPDWNSAVKKNEELEAAGKPQPYLVALFTNTYVSFPTSGTFAKTDDGHQVWRTQIKVDGAKAMGLYYDKFELPKGVKLYLSNANGYQVLGAYTSNNNSPEKTFANEAIQGSVVNIEMDIAPGVNLADINLHIDRAAVYNRSIENLIQYTVDPTKLHEIDFLDSIFAGVSSTCMINAICTQGSAYPNQRKASFQTLIPVGQGVGACSATMMNSTGNTGATCKQYFLLATHCDGANSTASSHFSQWLLRYNFQQANCAASTAVPTSNTLTGANFVARANYNEAAPIDQLKGDFLLLETRQAVPTAWDVVLSGWNHDPALATTVSAPKKFIGFHHPAGDVKKTSSTNQINGINLDGSTSNASHWEMLLNSGLVAGGSSGSGLFDGDGYLIGIASIAGQAFAPASCTVNAEGDAADAYDYAAYSKFAFDWDYSLDGPGNNRKLKPWLDPTNSGVLKLNPVKSNCTSLSGTGITTTNNALDNSISIYPNPSTSGTVNVKLNLASEADLTMDLYDVTGKKLNSYALKNIRSGAYTIDLSQYSNGIYLLKCSDGTATTSKKIMLTK